LHRLRTVLDQARSWFPEALAYTDELRVVVAEGIRSDGAEDIQLGAQVIKNTHAVEPSRGSRRVAARFLRAVASQVVDESYTSWDDSGVREDKRFLKIWTRSADLQYVEALHRWFKDVVGPAAHYRLWTENEVIDVFAHDEPAVESLAGTESADAAASLPPPLIARAVCAGHGTELGRWKFSRQMLAEPKARKGQWRRREAGSERSPVQRSGAPNSNQV